MSDQSGPATGELPATRWHHVPDLPIRMAPFTSRPVRMGDVARHVVRTWQPFKLRGLIFLATVVTWAWSTPSLDEARIWSLDWVGAIWLRNVAVLLVTAGLPHLWLYRWRRQGDDLRYDARPLGRGKRLFLFRDQVKDNILLTMVPAPVIAAGWESLWWWAAANGHAPHLGFADHMWWSILLIFLIPVWSVGYFSVGHWLLHRGPLYRYVHSWHHRNVNVGPWSGLSMHPVEHVVLYGDVLLFFVLPAHPVFLLYVIMQHHVGAPLGHTGYHGIRLTERFGGRLTLPIGDFFHQLHHRFIECNYGGEESPLDGWLDSFHDGTPEGGKHIAERRQRLNAMRRSTN